MKSPYEAGHPTRVAQNNAFCFGTITSVAPKSRLCTVKTFFSTNPALNDMHIAKCQWLNMDANTAGDEATSVPRRNSIGMVLFVQNEPFIFGFFRGLNKAGQALTGKEPTTLREGDKVISTQGGNRITVKASGLVEIVVKDTLKSLYLPDKSQWLNICRNFELKTDGGSWAWGSDADLNTLSKQIFRSDMAGSMIVIEERGNADGGVIYRTGIGPGASAGAIFFYEQTIGKDGTVITKVGPGAATYTQTISPDGSMKMECTADVEVHSTAGHIQITADAQDVAVLATLGDVNVEATAGDLKVNGSGAMAKFSKGQVGIGTEAVELLDLVNQSIQLNIQTLQAIEQLTVIGNLGYSTSPPVNVADFVQIQAKSTAMQTKLQTIIGSAS